MELKDFFKLALKLIAIFFTVEAIYIIASNIQYFLRAREVLDLTGIWFVASALLPLLMYYLIFVKSDKLMKVLKIDKGFTSQKVEFGNLSSSEILKISFILFGLFMLIQGLPNLIVNLVYAFDYSASPKFSGIPETAIFNYFDMIQSGVYVVLGYLMISNYKGIAKLFEKKS